MLVSTKKSAFSRLSAYFCSSILMISLTMQHQLNCQLFLNLTFMSQIRIFERSILQKVFFVCSIRAQKLEFLGNFYPSNIILTSFYVNLVYSLNPNYRFQKTRFQATKVCLIGSNLRSKNGQQQIVRYFKKLLKSGLLLW